jgi:tellurite resistance protein TerC
VEVELWVWGAFVGLVLALLALDLLVFHREAHVVGFREATWYSAFWIALGLLFTVPILVAWGPTAAGEYLAGYLIEKALSVDNIFVFALLFNYFAVPARYQHRVLFWGIIGALVFRAVFIAAGITLIERFHWVIYVLGAFLVYTGVRMARHDGEEVHPERNPALRIFRRIVPMTSSYAGQHLLVRHEGRLLATPLLAVLVLIETTDVVFAVDSIPAILAVTREPFLVFSSNAFAILGLRALYFMLAGMMDRFVYLKVGLAIVLIFVGVKMLVSEWYHVPIWASLAVIAITITVSVLASLRRTAVAAETSESMRSHDDEDDQPKGAVGP